MIIRLSHPNGAKHPEMTENLSDFARRICRNVLLAKYAARADTPAHDRTRADELSKNLTKPCMYLKDDIDELKQFMRISWGEYARMFRLGEDLWTGLDIQFLDMLDTTAMESGKNPVVFAFPSAGKNCVLEFSLK